jgi:hypothetical protein
LKNNKYAALGSLTIGDSVVRAIHTLGLAALDGLEGIMKSAEHYGDEIWLTFAKAE